MTTTNRLLRSRTDAMIAGVSGGLARYLGVDPVLIRLVFVVLAVSGPGIFIYPLLWIVMPLEPAGVAPGPTNPPTGDQYFVAEGTPTQRLRIDAMTGVTPDPEHEIPIQNLGEGRETPPPAGRNRLLGWALVGIGGFILVQMISPGIGSLLVPALLVAAGVWLLRK
jgi:phage shock protein C